MPAALTTSAPSSRTTSLPWGLDPKKGFCHSAQKQLAVQFVMTSGQYNLDGASHPAPEEAELKGNTQKQAGMMPCPQAVRSP